MRTSSNKVKAAWKITKETTGKTQPFYTITEINYEAGQITDTKEIVNASNNCLFK